MSSGITTARVIAALSVSMPPIGYVVMFPPLQYDSIIPWPRNVVVRCAFGAAPRICIRLLVWSRSACIRLIHRTSAGSICDEGFQQIRREVPQAAVNEQRLLGSYGVSIDRQEPEAGDR
jgi:hypothetical protein